MVKRQEALSVILAQLLQDIQYGTFLVTTLNIDLCILGRQKVT